MGITVNGNIIVKGDQIFDGGTKIVYGGDRKEKKQALTKESLKEKVDLIRNKLVNGRLWFPVCKFMMLEKLVPEGDFSAATAMLAEMYPDVSFNAKDLATLNVLSFRKDFAEWTDDDCPIKDRTTFFSYKNIGEALQNI